MELSTFISTAHRLIEAKEGGKKIIQGNMGERLGISGKTYENYWRGINKPKSMKAILNLLCQLDDNDILKMINFWREHEKTRNK